LSLHFELRPQSSRRINLVETRVLEDWLSLSLGVVEADAAEASLADLSNSEERSKEEKRDHAARNGGETEVALRDGLRTGGGNLGERATVADGAPLLVVADLVLLDAVDELRERDVGAVAERVDDLEVSVGRAVLDLETEVVARIVLIAAAELDRQSRGEVRWPRRSAFIFAHKREVLTDTLELGVLIGNLSHVEERDEGLVGNLLEEQLKWVAVVSDARERVEDRAEKGPASDVADAANVLIGEDSILVQVDEVAGLLDVGRRKTEGVGAVVRELRVNELMDLDKN
jgi:hypothetical protein